MTAEQHLEEIGLQADELEMIAHKTENAILLNFAHAFRNLVNAAQFSVDSIDKGANIE